MKSVLSRRLAALALGVGLASCGGDGASPAAPSAPALAPSLPSPSNVLAEASASLAPAGFRYVSHIDPRAGEDGVIRGESPLTVTIDVCDSAADAGKGLHFLFDWDGDGRAEVNGTGDACRQTHTYRMPASATGDVVLKTTVCVTNGDPSVRDGSTYFSCRTVRVGLPNPGVCGVAINTPRGCVNYAEGSFFWDGGAGPNGSFPYYDTQNCDGQPEGVTGPGERYVVACSDAEARRLCGEEASAGDEPISVNGQTLYRCGQNVK